MLVKNVDMMWSCGWRGGGGDRGRTSHLPCLAFAASVIFFFLGFLPFACFRSQTIFRCQKLIKDFACLISEDKCSQSTPAIAEAELACGKGTKSLFEIRICKGLKDNNYKFCSNYYYKNYHCDVR